MPNNSMDDLRNHLFDVIERLKTNGDPDATDKDKISIEDAKAIGNIAKTLIDSAKVEVHAIKALGMDQGSKFITPQPSRQEELQQLTNGQKHNS